MARDLVEANPKLMGERGMVSVTVNLKIGQKLGFIFIFRFVYRPVCFCKNLENSDLRLNIK
tara:strand:+ start:659 stop:841 length:183 start_codon:yes stop_codon:yes gene_type:complete